LFYAANLGKVDHLLKLDGAKERLHLFKADLLEEGSFDSAFEGCDGVFHTASPVFLNATDPQVHFSSDDFIVYQIQIKTEILLLVLFFHRRID